MAISRVDQATGSPISSGWEPAVERPTMNFLQNNDINKSVVAAFCPIPSYATQCVQYQQDRMAYACSDAG